MVEEWGSINELIKNINGVYTIPITFAILFNKQIGLRKVFKWGMNYLSYFFTRDLRMKTLENMFLELKNDIKKERDDDRIERKEYREIYKKELADMRTRQSCILKYAENFTEQEITLNGVNAKGARTIAHNHIRKFYKSYMKQMKLLGDNIVDPSVHYGIIEDCRTEYYRNWEHDHIEGGTNAKLRKLVQHAFDEAINFIVDKYSEEHLALFTNIQNGTRRSAIERACDFYSEKMIVKFDMEFWKLIDATKEVHG